MYHVCIMWYILHTQSSMYLLVRTEQENRKEVQGLCPLSANWQVTRPVGLVGRQVGMPAYDSRDVIQPFEPWQKPVCQRH